MAKFAYIVDINYSLNCLVTYFVTFAVPDFTEVFVNTEVLVEDKVELTIGGLKRVLDPIETARGLPNVCYTDARVIELERQKVFFEGWACAGFAMDAPDIGDLYPFQYAGLPLLMVRGEDNLVRIFHNVCQHRGSKLVDAPRTTKKAVVCPYHSWTYNLLGHLISAPHVGGFGKQICPGFDQDNISLREVRSAEWFGLIFVDLSDQAVEFDDYIEPVSNRWKDFVGVPLVHTGEDSTIKFELDCNWKLVVENYCEAYHLPWVHPELNAYSPLDRHYSIIEESYSGQGSESYAPRFPDDLPAFPNAPDLSEFWGTGSEYISLYPNVLLGIHRDHFYAVLVQSDGAGRTKERFEIFYYDEIVRQEKFDSAREANKKLWQTIFAEDRDAVESMQLGRSSPGFDGGIFSPEMDLPTHIFHKWIARALMDGRRATRITAE